MSAIRIHPFHYLLTLFFIRMWVPFVLSLSADLYCFIFSHQDVGVSLIALCYLLISFCSVFIASLWVPLILSFFLTSNMPCSITRLWVLTLICLVFCWPLSLSLLTRLWVLTLICPVHHLPTCPLSLLARLWVFLLSNSSCLLCADPVALFACQNVGVAPLFVMFILC